MNQTSERVLTFLRKSIPRPFAFECYYNPNNNTYEFTMLDGDDANRHAEKNSVEKWHAEFSEAIGLDIKGFAREILSDFDTDGGRFAVNQQECFVTQWANVFLLDGDYMVEPFVKPVKKTFDQIDIDDGFIIGEEQPSFQVSRADKAGTSAFTTHRSFLGAYNYASKATAELHVTHGIHALDEEKPFVLLSYNENQVVCTLAPQKWRIDNVQHLPSRDKAGIRHTYVYDAFLLRNDTPDDVVNKFIVDCASGKAGFFELYAGDVLVASSQHTFGTVANVSGEKQAPTVNPADLRKINAFELYYQLQDLVPFMEAQDFVKRWYEDGASSIEAEVYGEYDDQGGTYWVINSVTVYDEKDNEVPFNFYSRGWVRFLIQHDDVIDFEIDVDKPFWVEIRGEDRLYGDEAKDALKDMLDDSYDDFYREDIYELPADWLSQRRSLKYLPFSSKFDENSVFYYVDKE